MADNTVIIGRIAVKVMPDTSEFKEKARIALAKIEKKLDDVRVKLDLDDKGFQRNVNEAIRRAEESQVNVKMKIDDDFLRHNEKVYVKVKADFEKSAIAHAAVDIQKRLDKIKIDPKVDARKAQRMLDQIEDRLWAIRDVEMSISPEMNERAKREAMRKIRRLRDEVDNIQSQIKPEVAELPYRHAAVRLAILARNRIVHLLPRVSKSAAAGAATTLAALTGARLAGDVFQRLWDGVKNIDKAAPKIAKTISLLATLSSSIFASTSNIFALGGSLVSILPLLLSLPGIMGGIAIGAGITFVALKDFKKELPKVADEFKKLGKVISGNFWSKARKPIEEMSNKLLPMLRKEFGLTSTAVGKWFGSFAKDIGISLLPSLRTMFDNLNDSIGIFEHATKPLAGIIESLGLMGSEQLPDLASWMDRLLGKFDTWLKKIRSDGTWDKWVETAKTALHDFGRVFKSTFSILSDIAHTASKSGGAGLGTLADTLERINKITSGARFQTGLGRIFSGAHGFFDNLGKMSKPFGDFIYQLSKTVEIVLPRIGDALSTIGTSLFKALAKPETQKAIQRLFDGIARGVEGLAPYLPDIVDGIAALAEAFGEFVAAAGPNLGIMLAAVADALKEVAPLLPDLAKEVLPVLADAVKTLAPLLAEIAKDVLPVLVDALKTILPYIEKGVKWFKEFADEEPNLAALAVAIGAVAFALGGFKGVLAGLLTGTFKLAWKFVAAPALKSLGKATTPIFTKLGQAIGKTGIGRFLTKHFNVKWTFGLDKAASGSIASRILGPIGLALGGIEVAHFLFPTVTRMSTWMEENLPAPFGGSLKTAIGGALANPAMRTYLTGGVEKMLDDIWPDRFPWQDPPPAKPVDFGKLKTSVTEFVDGVGGAAHTMELMLRPLGEKFKTAFDFLPTNVKSALTEAGKSITDKTKELYDSTVAAAKGVKESILSAFTGQRSGVAGAVTSMLSGIEGVVKQTLNPVPDKGTEARDKLASALSNGKSQVTSAAGTMVSGILGAISPPLAGADGKGKSIGASFAGGIGSMWSTVKRAADSLSSASTPYVPNMFTSGQSIGASFAAGIGSMWKSVWNAASSIVSAARGLFPNSPAKEGPFSGKGWVIYSGQSIGEAFAQGLLDQVAQVKNAALEVANAAHDGLDTINGKTLDVNTNFRAGSVGGLSSDEVAAASADRVSVVVNNINPVAEPGSTSVNRNMRRLAMAGVI